ncbi:MAG: iron-sulfur cluster assembly accessory protein [Nitrospirota bacterium]|nr:iron-sulfur cluster assembly accessory protein [Nitrospirota bacterium]
MIELTEAAANEVERLKKIQNKENYFLRLGIEGGGCSGLSYLIKLEETPGEFDEIVDGPKDIHIVVDPKSKVYLTGSTLDFTGGGLMGGGFTFKNPNASHSCGCGSSFSA